MVTLRRQRWLLRLALAGILALAAVNFLWQLGSSSLYVDEVQSIAASLEPLSKVIRAVGLAEVTPPAYVLFLHEWLYALGPSHLDWLARLPSALGGILLVAAVMWLASLTLRSRLAVLFTGLLAACSPFGLEHAQRAQGYLFVALGTAVAAAAVIEAERRPPARAAGSPWR